MNVLPGIFKDDDISIFQYKDSLSFSKYMIDTNSKISSIMKSNMELEEKLKCADQKIDMLIQSNNEMSDNIKLLTNMIMNQNTSNSTSAPKFVNSKRQLSLTNENLNQTSSNAMKKKQKYDEVRKKIIFIFLYLKFEENSKNIL